VALERAAGASWTTIGAAQDPPVSRQAAQQRYQRLLRRANLGGTPGVTVGSVQPTYSGTRAKRWTALINGVSVLGGRAFPSRDKAAIQVLLEHEHRQDRATRDGRRRGSPPPHEPQCPTA
jgi:hypothetical protein